MRVRDLLRMNTGHLKEQADAFWSTEKYNVGFGETKWEELTATAQMGERVER